MFIVLVIVLIVITGLCIYVPIEVLTKDMSEEERQEVWKNFHQQLEDNKDLFK